MEQSTNKPTCANHRKDVFGVSDMEELANAIGDLHYETLTILMSKLSNKIKYDAEKDDNGGRKQLASTLYRASEQLKYVSEFIGDAWVISKKYME